MQTLGVNEEQQLLEAVKQAVDLVDHHGMSPDAAITKVARDGQLGPGKVRLIANAYNTGRQTAQRENEANILDKLASFPLADPANVLNALYGQAEPEAKVSSDYASPPDLWLMEPRRLKLARAALPSITPPVHEPEPIARLHSAYGMVERSKKAAEDKSRRVSDLEDSLRGGIATLVRYFRKSAADRLSFTDVEHAAKQYFGTAAVPLMELTYQQAHLREKRAAQVPLTTRGPGFDLRAEPFSLIRNCLDLASQVCAARGEYKQALEKTAKVREEVFRPFVPSGGGPAPPSPEPTSQSSTGLLGNVTKQAIGFFGAPALGAAVGTMLTRGISGVPQSSDDIVEKAWLELEDPQHQNELRKIRAHAMLNAMLTDPDDPISSFDPDEVLQAYNEIAQLAPRISEQPAALKPILRRRLQGNTQPFEAKEITDIEQGIAKSKLPTPNTSILGDAPDRILA